MATAEVHSIPIPPLDLVELRHRRRESALTQMVAAGEAAGILREPEVVLATLLRVHRLVGSAANKGVAVPHARSHGVLRPALLLGRSVRGVEWGAEDGNAVQIVVMVLSPSSMHAAIHVERVATAMHLLRLQKTRQRFLDGDASTAVAVLQGSGA